MVATLKAEMKRLREDVDLLRFDVTNLIKMVRAIMNHLGNSEPPPTSRT